MTTSAAFPRQEVATSLARRGGVMRPAGNRMLKAALSSKSSLVANLPGNMATAVFPIANTTEDMNAAYLCPGRGCLPLPRPPIPLPCRFSQNRRRTAPIETRHRPHRRSSCAPFPPRRLRRRDGRRSSHATGSSPLRFVSRHRHSYRRRTQPPSTKSARLGGGPVAGRCRRRHQRSPVGSKAAPAVCRSGGCGRRV